MSEITPDLVRHLAGLSRILVTDEEVERFTEQLSLIVDSVAKVNEALEGVDEPRRDGFRADDSDDTAHIEVSYFAALARLMASARARSFGA